MTKLDYKYKFNYYTLLLIAFVIPLHKGIAPIAISLFFISSIINNNFKSPPKQISRKSFILLISLYAFYLLGMLYSSDKPQAYFSLEEKLSLLAFPISVYISNLNFKKDLHKILLSFVEGCLISVIMSLINSI
ncbi:MAG: hypothetical protein R3255_08760, partial [Candidatus Lokiarchaeia archaeon]|nr:hypothetical protein [Candidatus Lokiarchaeia archaeon]